MIKKIIYKLLVRLLIKRGYSPYMAQLMVREIFEELVSNNGTTLKQKLWAYKNGFFSKRITRFGLTKENMSLYFPDFKYYKLHPINGKYSKWIDDKLTMRLIFSPFSEYLPDYYFEISRGNLVATIDSPATISDGPELNDLICMLKKLKCLALKPSSGTGGKGFYKLTYNEIGFCINEKPCGEQELMDLVAQLDNYIITEYVFAHPDIRKVYDKTPGTLRVISIYDREFGAKITGALMRFGSTHSGMVDNACAGGVYCGVDLDNGRLFGHRITINGKTDIINTHPDTGERMDMTLPHWNHIKETLINICSKYPQLIYMGFDVIITENSFRIIEINSHSDLNYMEIFTPFLKNKYNQKFFANLMNTD